jgi:tetratricopeptide (TPR) repeat protein
MRADELAALTQALTVLESTVSTKAQSSGAGGRHKPVTTALATKATTVTTVDDEDDDDDDDVAFVQTKTEVRRAAAPDAETEIRKQLVSLLRTTGAKLHSPVLSTLAVKVSEDPFVKIKGLIQELIERLLQEEADEADKKGWCDKEIAAAQKDRDYRLRDVDDLHSQLESLNARKGELTKTKGELEKALEELRADLATQTANRAEEKAENEQTVKDSEEGEAAVDQAIDILSHFYGAAAKATVLAQQSPDDEAPDAGFDGAYTGSQSASTGIMGMLEVIKGDFARSIKETKAAEDQAQRDFIEFERETKMSITTKETGLDHTDRELTETNDSLSTAGDELRTQQGLLDAAVETWEKLIPGCVADPGMSYEERVQRRNAEVQALKDAYCILGNEEPGCSGVF